MDFANNGHDNRSSSEHRGNGVISDARRELHEALVTHGTLCLSDGMASNTDAVGPTGRAIAAAVASRLGALDPGRTNRTQSGAVTESAESADLAEPNFRASIRTFLECTFPRLDASRPRQWLVGGTDDGPKVVIRREPASGNVMSGRVMGGNDPVVDDGSARGARLRCTNSTRPILHAVVSCMWTVEPPRVQRLRAEAATVIEQRSGRAPHVVAVTCESAPSTLATLVLGAREIDAMYHVALPELIAATSESGNDEAVSMMTTLVDSGRLRGISNLPLDLAV